MSFSRENSTTGSSASYGQPIDRRQAIMPLPSALTASHSKESAEPPQRTLEDVRDQVAQSIVVRAMRKAKVVDGTKVGVILTLASSSDAHFLQLVATKLQHAFITSHHLFALAPATAPSASPLIICASDDTLVHRAVLLVGSKFLGRMDGDGTYSPTARWLGHIHDLGSSAYDEAALWDAVRKAAGAPMDPLSPPPGSRSIDTILAQARARLQRITPQEAYEELRAADAPWPVVLVDIRPEAQRFASGIVRGALVVERNVLEWRFDPRCRSRLPIADRYDLRVIVFCQEGFTSSLAAAALHDLGLLNATDIIGGIEAWKAAGLPTDIDHPVSSITPSEEY